MGEGIKLGCILLKNFFFNLVLEFLYEYIIWLNKINIIL